MRIGELARQTGVDPYTLRFYEKIGLLPRPARKENRYREYTEADQKRLLFIKKAKSLGLSLAEIHHILDLAEKRKRPCREVRKILEGKLQQLRAQIESLQSLREELESHVKALPEEGLEGEICGCIESHQVFLKKTLDR